MAMSSLSLISGNPASFLTMSQVLQYFTLFIFIPLKDYPQ